ncbi:MAG: PCRF domain-containing protein, partial [Pseudomonadales bacterium]
MFDLAGKEHRLEEVELTLADPDVWNDPDNAQSLNKERSTLQQIVNVLATLEGSLSDISELAELAAAESDQATLTDLDQDLDGLQQRLEGLEFRRMFQGEMDAANAFMEIQPGSGGIEAQDWAEML